MWISDHGTDGYAMDTEMGISALLLAPALLLPGWMGAPPPEGIAAGTDRIAGAEMRCAAAPWTPDRVELQATGHAPGAEGHLELVMPETPFGVAVSGDGRYVYDVTLTVRQLRRRPGMHYVAWATTPELDQVKKLGVLGEGTSATGRVDWNKFLVLISEEATADVETWQGAILLTGMSPSGLMHTMAGHGIFEAHTIGC